MRSTENQEFYQRITDHVPMGSPVLVEDGNARGKSVLTRQIMYGVMKQGLSVNLFTTGSTTGSFIKHVGSISLAVSHYLVPAYLKEFRPDVVGFKWNKAEIENILRHLIAGIRHSTVQGRLYESTGIG